MFEVLLLAAAVGLAQDAGSDADVTKEAQALLSSTDPFARAPRSSRARLEVKSGGRVMKLEVWRSGADALVRFLDPKERGKYLLRREAGTYFISPGSRRPVRLPPTHRLANAVALDELLGVPLATSHDIVSFTYRDIKAGIMEFYLHAKSPASAYPGLRWVVSVKDDLPLRAEFLLADGRLARIHEWKEWRDRATLQPRSMVIKDLLRGGSTATVEILELEARDVPAELFSLTDPSARAALQDPR
jgi:outer membrane lipoprotein-sorting protein